jgi:hypothetical protein
MFVQANVNDLLIQLIHCHCSHCHQHLWQQILSQRFFRSGMVQALLLINLLLCNIYHANKNTFKLSMKRLSYYILPIYFNSVFAPPPSADEFDLCQIHLLLPCRLDTAAHARDNLADCPSDSTYCVISDAGLISCLLQQ